MSIDASAAQARKKAPVRLLFCGRKGSGRSSLANALAGRELAWSVGEGKAPASASWESGGLAVKALEMPGFGAGGEAQARRFDASAMALAGADLLILAAPAPEEAWSLEAEWLGAMLEAAPDFPAIVCATRIDLLGSPRDWRPETLDLEHPASPKERAVCAWAGRLAEALAGAVPQWRKERFCLTAAGGADPAGEGLGAVFGIDALRRLVADCLPDPAQKHAMLARAFDRDIVRPRAEKVIWTAAVSAAAASLAPVPAVDAAMVATVQAGMIVAIAGLYGCVLSRKTALAMLAPLAGAAGVRIAAASALKLLPGLGHIASAAVGAAVAGPLTLAAGYAFLDFFARAEFNPSPEELRRVFAEKYREAGARKDELLRKAREGLKRQGQSKA